MLKILKTDRKRGGWLILVSQSPEDAINSSIFPAIVQQTPTKIFLPNPDAEYEGSYQRCGISRKEYQQLVELPLESRTFLVKQSKQSAFAKLDLFGMHEPSPYCPATPPRRAAAPHDGGVWRRRARLVPAFRYGRHQRPCRFRAG